MKYCLLAYRVFISCSVGCLLSQCAGEKGGSGSEASNPRASLQDRLSESGGFKQDADGNWVPKSDKRSSYDTQRDSPYFKGNVKKETYRTGDYAKKSWWGKKDYKAGAYQGETDGSRFQTQARQQGQVASDSGRKARLEGPYETKTLGYEAARETRTDELGRPSNAYTKSQQSTYKAPSVIDWNEQRKLSLEESRGILGR